MKAKKVLENKFEYLRADICSQSDTVLIVFSHTGYPAGKFAMSTAFASILVHKIYVNCANNSWYQQGIPEVSSSIDETVDVLREILRMLRPSKVICTGMSMGGYAALLFGLKLECDIICAFTSEITVGNENSRSWTMNKSRGYDYKYRSLSNLILENKQTKIYAIYGSYDLIDLSLLWSITPAIRERNLIKTFFVSGGHTVTYRLNIPSIIEKLIQERNPQRRDISEKYCLDDDVTDDEIFLYRELQILQSKKNAGAIHSLLRNYPHLARRPGLCLHYANASIDLRRFEDAESAIHSGLSLDEECQPLYHAQGILETCRGNWTEAKSAFLNSIRLDPNALMSHYRLGIAHENLNELNEAELCYRRASSHQDAKNRLLQLLTPPAR